MSEEIKMLELLLKGQDDIKEQLKRVHDRLDEVSEKSTINQQSIKHLEKNFDTEKAETEKKFNVVHQSIRRRGELLKWLFASIIVPVVLSIMAFFKISPN